MVKMNNSSSTSSSSSSKSSKRCLICGDVAICFNFDVLTCGPCRLFFYRNAHKRKNWICFTNGNCEIRGTNRRYCAKCRMEKCFYIGMKPKARTKNNKTHEITLKSVLEFKEFESESSVYENCYEIKLPKSIIKNFFEFNQTESAYISELVKTTSSIFNFDESRLPVLYEETNFYHTFNLGSYYIRRIIKYCKSNSVFRSMNEQQEQLHVLKQFITEFLMIRFAFAYNPEIGSYCALANEEGNGSVFSKLKVFYQLSDDKEVVQSIMERKMKKSDSLNAEMERDSTIRELLIVQALFDSNANVSDTESLKYHYWTYHRLLLRYLQCKYKDLEKAQLKYTTLIKIFHELKEGRKKLQNVLLTLDRTLFAELTVEMLNI